MISIGLRTRHCLLACLFLVSSSAAFARGGPGGALGAVLETSLEIAIVVGLVAGAFCAHALRRMPWEILVFVSVVGFVAAVTFPFPGMVLGLPSILSCAVFASIFYVVRGGIFRARAFGPLPTASDVDLQGEARGASEVFRWIAATYGFWVVVSLVNFELLGFLAVAPIAILSSDGIGRFLPFILPPLAVALLVGVFVTALVVKRHGSSRHVAPFIFNACVLVAFFLSAEVFRHHLMTNSLRDHRPGHLERSSFLTSVLAYRTYARGRHGGFEENGRTYRWSYAERQFVQRPQANPPLEPSHWSDGRFVLQPAREPTRPSVQDKP